MSFEKKIKRLSHRNWADVKNAWLPHVAQLTLAQPGQAPDAPLSEFHALAPIAPQVPQDGEYRCDVSGFRTALLHEGIYLLHKAANVLVASQTQVTEGLPTWSIATAYQSTFFSMEALLKLLGVTVVEVNNKTLLLDVWPTAEQAASKKVKALYKLGSEIQCVHHSRLEHHHRWAILKRVLRTLNNSPINQLVINAIDSIDDKDFARQRNRLHYSNEWAFNDLHSYYSPLTYCRFQSSPSLIARLYPDCEDFTVVLSTVLFSSTVSLLSSLGEISPMIADEHRLLDMACSVDRMRLRSDFEMAMDTPMV